MIEKRISLVERTLISQLRRAVGGGASEGVVALLVKDYFRELRELYPAARVESAPADSPADSLNMAEMRRQRDKLREEMADLYLKYAEARQRAEIAERTLADRSRMG